MGVNKVMDQGSSSRCNQEARRGHAAGTCMHRDTTSTILGRLKLMQAKQASKQAVRYGMGA